MDFHHAQGRARAIGLREISQADAPAALLEDRGGPSHCLGRVGRDDRTVMSAVQRAHPILKHHRGTLKGYCLRHGLDPACGGTEEIRHASLTIRSADTSLCRQPVPKESTFSKQIISAPPSGLLLALGLLMRVHRCLRAGSQRINRGRAPVFPFSSLAAGARF